ncbi:MAG TPA: hypothetical protein VMA98_12670 [Candidatus Acidoferrales bacterium]|nr:hypothetical protein [Candidatus Acidoferrales bacterium]
MRERNGRNASYLATALVALAFTLPFCLRAGLPALHHDWIWPATREQFWLRFVADLSTWSPYGFGADTDAPSIDVIPAALWLLASVGLGSKVVLAIFLATIFTAGQIGTARLIEALGLRIGFVEKIVLGAGYAFGPVCFEKFAAGQLYYVAAYELLPIFALLLIASVHNDRSWWRAAIGAGLVLTVMEGQIQFLGFCLLLSVIFTTFLGCRPRDAFRSVSLIFAIALMRDLPMLANFATNVSVGLVAQHPTAVWERDLSGSLGSLLLLGGYEQYDTGALPAGIAVLYHCSCYVAVALAAAAIPLALAARSHRRVVVAAMSTAIIALAWALGLNGPLGDAFLLALTTTPLFTIVREFYHVMALYALSISILAAVALSIWRSPLVRVALVCIAATALPFAFSSRIVPASNLALDAQRTCQRVRNLCLLFPEQPPVGDRTSAASGIDPASLSGNIASTPNMPVFWEFALERLSRGNASLVEALGVQYAAARPGLISRLPDVFEPNVGARFSAFRVEQERLRRRLAERAPEIPGVDELYVERDGAASPLDGVVPDAAIPPGHAGKFTYSYSDNDVDTSWVWGRLWAWSFPSLMSTAAEPVVTRSDAELPIDATAPHGVWCYVLAAAQTATLDGNAPAAVFAARGAYKWYVWRVSPLVERVNFRASGSDRAVARAIFSDVARWRPARDRAAAAPTAVVPSSSSFPWQVEGTLPVIGPAGAQLVFARSYSPQWHLFVGTDDRGPARRLHGLLNGWRLTGKDSEKTIRLLHLDQTRVTILNACEALFLAGLLAALLPIRRRPAS